MKPFRYYVTLKKGGSRLCHKMSQGDSKIVHKKCRVLFALTPRNKNKICIVKSIKCHNRGFDYLLLVKMHENAHLRNGQEIILKQFMYALKILLELSVTICSLNE